MIDPIELFTSGKFVEAAEAYKELLKSDPDNWAAIGGLSKSLLASGEVEASVPLFWRLHERDKRRTLDSPGQQHYLACAYWCAGNRRKAIELMSDLTKQRINRTINMAPDAAHGATYPLLLHYFAITEPDCEAVDLANRAFHFLEDIYLQKHNASSSEKRSIFQLLGRCSFEDVVEGISGSRDVHEAERRISGSRARLVDLATALFHDGAYQRSIKNETGAKGRFQSVWRFGRNCDLIRWCLAKNEFSRLDG